MGVCLQHAGVSGKQAQRTPQSKLRMSNTWDGIVCSTPKKHPGLFKDGDVFVYAYIGDILVREVQNSFVLTCSLEAKAGEVVTACTKMAGAAVHVETVPWSRPLTMRQVRRAGMDYAILTA